MPQSIQITETSALRHGANCVYCHGKLEIGNEVAVCDSCQSPHHVDCWQANGSQCASFGCNDSNAVAPHNESGIEQGRSTLSVSGSTSENLLFFVIALIISPLCYPLVAVPGYFSTITERLPILLIVMIAVVLGIVMKLLVRLAIRVLSTID